MAEPTLTGKRWEPAREEKLLQTWEPDLYRFDPGSGKPIFTIDTPPPYPSGMSWHIGAVASYSLIDMIARSLRMRGYEVLFPFGLDRNGINIERTVERKYDKPLHEWDRQEFIDVCREEVDRQSEVYLKTVHRIGFSADFDNHYYETDSPEYRAMSQGIFLELFAQGYFYRDLRPTFYCPGDRTVIAEADIEYETRPAKLVHVAFQGKEGAGVTIATTRPELLFACDAVVVHPDDDRYTDLQGATLLVPPIGKEIQVYPHPAADPEFGTGAAMICSYGDTTDIQLFRELALNPVAAIDEEGRMTAAAGAYEGMTVVEARHAITSDLEEAGVIEKVEEIAHKTPVCGRSGDAIEFVQMEDWYMRQLDALPALRKLVGEMEFHPSRHRQLLLDWINALTIDWPVGRQRYYHTEIPLWYCEDCGEALAPPPGPYYQPWKDPAPFEVCPHCQGTAFRGEQGVFDTWMDSSNTNLVATLYHQDDAFFKAHFPASLRPQGRDIVRNWLYYTLLKSYRLLGQKPFEHVFIHGMGLDKLGRAMHDSLGNVVEPGPVFEEYGVDAFRFWAASETNVGEDFRVSEGRIRGARKFLTKLWNVARFISSFPESKAEAGELAATDRWILAELSRLVEDAQEGFQDFNFFGPANRVRDFLWNLFAPHYMEMVKHRAYDGDPAALRVLHHVLRDLLRLLAPISPFITDIIWREMYGGSVHREALPTAEEGEGTEWLALTPVLLDFNSSVWKEKKEKGLALREGLDGVTLPEELRPFADDLSRMHHIRW